MPRKRVAILISGRGSNMAALIDAANDASFPADVALVVSNRAQAAGLTLAREAGTKAAVVEHTRGAEREAFEKSPAFKNGQRFRAGIEGRVSVLFRGRGMKPALPKVTNVSNYWSRLFSAVLRQKLAYS